LWSSDCLPVCPLSRALQLTVNIAQYAYRVTERIETNSNSKNINEPAVVTEVLKHDNDDDGEDAAGSRLAHLLAMRGDDGVLVLVSRWYGGIKLGPKRFAHITNAARAVLDVVSPQQSCK